MCVNPNLPSILPLRLVPEPSLTPAPPTHMALGAPTAARLPAACNLLSRSVYWALPKTTSLTSVRLFDAEMIPHWLQIPSLGRTIEPSVHFPVQRPRGKEGGPKRVARAFSNLGLKKLVLLGIYNVYVHVNVTTHAPTPTHTHIHPFFPWHLPRKSLYFSEVTISI